MKLAPESREGNGVRLGLRHLPRQPEGLFENPSNTEPFGFAYPVEVAVANPAPTGVIDRESLRRVIDAIDTGWVEDQSLHERNAFLNLGKMLSPQVQLTTGQGISLFLEMVRGVGADQVTADLGFIGMKEIEFQCHFEVTE